MKIEAPAVDPTFSVRQVALYYLIGTDNEQMITRWIRQGDLKAIKNGKEYRISSSDIREFNKAHMKLRYKKSLT